MFCDICGISVQQRVKKCLFAKDGSHSYVRSMITGTILVTFFIQIGLFREVRKSISWGQLPWYTSELLILWLGIVETCLAAGIGGIFRERRRDVIIAGMLQLDILALLMLAATGDDPPEGNDLCEGGSNFTPSGLTTPVALRLMIYIVLLTSASVAVMAAWAHGIAYMYEHKNEGLLVHYGILVFTRIVGPIMFRQVLQSMSMWLLTIAVCGQLTVHILQMFKVPSQPPGFQSQICGSSFMSSFGRIVSNKMAMTHIFAMGFLVAAFWGFAWHEVDIVKAKYLLQSVDSWMTTYANILHYHFIVLAVLFIAMKYSGPIMASFSLTSAAIMTSFCTFFTIPLFLMTLVVLRCNQGSISGLSGTTYRQPGCSEICGCKAPFDSFSPVCAIDTMTTYLSPCHAGCSNTEVFNGIPVLTNCSCGAFGKMARGPCAVELCYVPYELHKLGYLFLIIFTVLALMLQGRMLLCLVDPRDTSTAIGVMTSVIALCAFVGGNVAFFFVNVHTCVWFRGGECQLHNYLFAYILYGLCSGLALVAFIINLTTYFILRRHETMEKSEDTDEQLSHRNSI